MNEIHLSVESIQPKPPSEEEENERDPLAFGEEEGERETDPLAPTSLMPHVKTEPDSEPLEQEVSIETVHVNKVTESKGDGSVNDYIETNETGNMNMVNIPEVNKTPEITSKSNCPLEAIEKSEKGDLVNRKLMTKEIQIKPSPQQKMTEFDTECNAVPETNKIPEIKFDDPKLIGSEKHECYQKLNGDVQKQPTSKRSSESLEPETPNKKLCSEVQKAFPHHDNMINDYIQNTTHSVDEIQQHSEQLLAEIQTLRELAQKKELEWNNILHLKKVKEEILLRLLRRKQVLAFEKSPTINGTDRATETRDLIPQPKNFTIDKNDEISGVVINQSSTSVGIQSVAIPIPPPAHSTPHCVSYNPLPAPPPYDKPPAANSISKATFPHPMGMRGPTPSMPMFGVDLNEHFMARYNSQMGRQGPVKDVKSIIADYRQRHPETVPRRGRRLKSMLSQGGHPRASGTKMDSLNNLGMLLNNMDMNQKSMLERLTQAQASGLPNGVSFKDILVQFANIQQHNATGLQIIRPQLENLLTAQAVQNQRPQPQLEAVTVTKTTDKESPRLLTDKTLHEHKSSEQRAIHPPPYPEISLHPVVSSSNSDQTQHNSSLLHGILTKSCGEITITPVQPKNKEPASAPCEPVATIAEQVVQLEDEESAGASDGSGEAEGSSGEGGSRLVIDEAVGGSGGGDVPLCQGCRRRDAQFVCAGCANQWYCSRECQVAAWDDHSEMCSG